jgi:hypothetical protein
MPIQIEIPDDFFKTDEKKKLKALFRVDTDKDFKQALELIVLASLEEYRDMFLGMGLPSRVNEIREYRLYYLIKNYMRGRIPTELEVSMMFQLPETRAKSLILYVLTRFRYQLEEEINNTLKEIIGSAECIKQDDVEEYRVVIGSENMVDELDRIIIQAGNLRLKKLTKVRGETNIFSIAPDSYKILRTQLKLNK